MAFQLTSQRERQNENSLASRSSVASYISDTDQPISFVISAEFRPKYGLPNGKETGSREQVIKTVVRNSDNRVSIEDISLVSDEVIGYKLTNVNNILNRTAI